MTEQGYVLLVNGDDGRTFFVGRRHGLESAVIDAQLYRDDPIQSGWTFAVHVDERGRVTWSDDWVAVTDAGLAGQLRRVFHSGHGDPYAQYEEYFLPERLLSLEASRAADPVA